MYSLTPTDISGLYFATIVPKINWIYPRRICGRRNYKRNSVEFSRSEYTKKHKLFTGRIILIFFSPTAFY